VLKRLIHHLSAAEIDDVLDYLCRVAKRNAIFYLWRPVLKEPDDDFVLELAVKAEASIVTFNVADFRRAADFGIRVMTPRELLQLIEEIP
jgi:predicted nucleic acid-binding protein